MKTPEEYTKDELMAQKWLNEIDTMQFSEMEILLMFARDYHSEKMKEVEQNFVKLAKPGGYRDAYGNIQNPIIIIGECYAPRILKQPLTTLTKEG